MQNTDNSSRMSTNISGNISKQIEYIAGTRWNMKYNKWLADFYNFKPVIRYHNMSKINWDRILKKFDSTKFGNLYFVTLHPDLTWHNLYYIIQIYMKHNSSFPCYISQHPNITWDIIQDNSDYPWNWDWISRNPNITWDIIQANLDKPWDWEFISCNSSITWDIIQTNPDKPWDWSGISRNSNITWDIIRDNPNKPWDKHCIVQNNKFTVQARISIAKHTLNANRETNYLAKYIQPNYKLIILLLEYGY